MGSASNGTLEPYMVISENFIYVPGWDERTPPNKIKIYIRICTNIFVSTPYKHISNNCIYFV